MIERYARKRDAGERFGEFAIRKGDVVPTASGRDFHANVSPEVAAQICHCPGPRGRTANLSGYMTAYCRNPDVAPSESDGRF